MLFRYFQCYPRPVSIVKRCCAEETIEIASECKHRGPGVRIMLALLLATAIASLKYYMVREILVVLLLLAVATLTILTFSVALILSQEGLLWAILWTKGLTASKKLERLRGVYKFALQRKMVQENHALALVAPKLKPNPTLPFSKEDMAETLKAADSPDVDRRVKAFILTMRYSGRRIFRIVSWR